MRLPRAVDHDLTSRAVDVDVGFGNVGESGNHFSKNDDGRRDVGFEAVESDIISSKMMTLLWMWVLMLSSQEIISPKMMTLL